MIAMQYSFTLPADYDMSVIDRRIADTGPLLDGFPGLKFKAYLVARRGEHSRISARETATTRRGMSKVAPSPRSPRSIRRSGRAYAFVSGANRRHSAGRLNSTGSDTCRCHRPDSVAQRSGRGHTLRPL